MTRVIFYSPIHFVSAAPSRFAASSTLRSPACIGSDKLIKNLCWTQSQGQVFLTSYLSRCGKHWIVFLRSCSYDRAPRISLSPRWQWSGPSPWGGPSCPQPWKYFFKSNQFLFYEWRVCQPKGPNISYYLVSPYSEGDLSLVPLKNNEISLPSIKPRQPFIQKHLTRTRVILSQYLKLSCRFSVFRLPRSFCSCARRDWK